LGSWQEGVDIVEVVGVVEAVGVVISTMMKTNFFFFFFLTLNYLIMGLYKG
jgi:hypothetical protein